MSLFVSLMVAAIVLIGIGLLIIILLTNKPGRHLDQAKYRERWMTIMGGLDDTPSAMALTVIQADKLLDLALKERGAAGNTLGERMKSSKDLFSDRNGIWQAHKLRNHVAHDDNVKLDIRKTRRALNAFKKALADVGAL
ncbi:MAG TPA: hypothetical protein VFK03_00565 [Candidatus Saccharimonadales bacterium]|nr:hypothetical protein [Candidatus Saccharimonadales bacterium]